MEKTEKKISISGALPFSLSTERIVDCAEIFINTNLINYEIA